MGNGFYIYTMKLILCSIVTLALACNIYAQDSATFRMISDEIMWRGTCYDNLRVLCKQIGHRVSGSAQAAKAVEWGRNAMQQAGADKTWLQAVDVPHWVRGREKLSIQFGKGKFIDVPMLSLGNSEGTKGQLLEAPVIMVNNFSEFHALPASEVKGKIIFFNYRFRQDFIETFNGYGDAVKYRGAAANVASPKGAAAVIIRSVSTAPDDAPHTGAMHYADSVKRKIPAVAIGNKTADRLEETIKKGSFVRAQLQSECTLHPDMVRSYNVIGEITGTEHPEKIIVVGGHLDSWDVGEGADDDGAGCVQSIEVLRTIKALGIQPKHTIRAVLFMNEENGLKGGLAYADSAKKNDEQHILAIESDAGSGAPRGFGLLMKPQQKAQILHFKDLFLPYGLYDFSQEDGGADISPLGKMGVPLSGLIPEPQRYFDIHHSPNDVFERVSHRELKLGAVAMTQLVYLVDKYGLK